MREQSATDPDRKPQLTALQYYIHDVIKDCEESWVGSTHGNSNYRTLLDQIRRYPQTCFVTFNYDTLLEAALRGLGVHFPDIETYALVPKYKLFKLHGSIDWHYWVPASKTSIRHIQQPSNDDLINASPNIDTSSVVTKVGAPCPPSLLMERCVHLPALAIPTVSKGSFVCPDEHLVQLRECIPQIEKILIVGWRGGERHFLREFIPHLRKPVDVLAACGTQEESTNTLARLKTAGLMWRSDRAYPGGFTDLIKSDALESFLSALPGS